MKKLKMIMCTIILCMFTLLSVPISVLAAEKSVIDRVEISVDVPVDGVKLKNTATVEEYLDNKNMQTRVPNTATDVYCVLWYKESAPSVVLSDGYKAKMGERYIVEVVLETKGDYVFADNMAQYANKVNGNAADTFECRDNDNNLYWSFSTKLDTIAAISGNPVVTYKKMELSPYEGNPMELVVEATGTNLKYQWQICYDTDAFDGEVDLDDNKSYKGTKTAHFQMPTYFGYTFDEELNFAKIRCKVTSDSGTSYSQEVWFVVRDRTVVNALAITDLAHPTYGEKADYAVKVGNGDQYKVDRMVWYGPKQSDGTYKVMSKTATFEKGEYYCAIYISTTDPYKFNDNTTVSVNGTEQTLHTIKGVNREEYMPDTYYIEVPFTAKEQTIKQIAVTDIKVPVADEPVQDASYRTATVAADAPYTLGTVAWFNGDGTIIRENHFWEDSDYRIRVVLVPKEGYQFDLNETNQVTINGKRAALNKVMSNGNALVECIYTVQKKPSVSINLFTDVKESDYYYEAVFWAVDNGITAGITETKFGPNLPCTRAQAVTFLWRDAGQPEPESYDNPFTDVKSDTYYYKAVLWAVENGITAGLTRNKFAPDMNCTRGQIVTFMWRAAGQEIVQIQNPFKDVKSGDYYYEAVLWAVENKITAGLTKDAFCPNMDCTRSQIVSFLYRNAVNEKEV